MVVPSNVRGVQSLADLQSKRVGIVTGTVAIAEKDHQVVRFDTREDLLDGFHAQRLDGAFIDADFAAWHLHRQPDLRLRVVEEYVPHERWNMTLAVRAGDSGRLVKLNRALAELSTKRQIRKVYADHGVTFRPPFTNTSKRAVSHDSWERIQQRGEIVFGMDPANWPYSSATEELPGIDVELARALAQELGLKLRLNWIDVQRETATGQLLERECDLAFGTAIDPGTVDDDVGPADVAAQI